MMRDMLSRLDFKSVLPPQVAVDNTVLNGNIIDLLGYDGCTFVINLGTLADADATFAIGVQHGDAANLSDAVAVDAGDLVGSVALAGFTFADDNKTRKIGYRGVKRYVRPVVTPTSNAGNAPISIMCVLGMGRFYPTPNPTG